MDPNLEIYYWKDARHIEADFVVKEKSAVREIIQVCWNIDDPKTKKREIDSLVKAMDNLKMENGLIITEDYEGEYVRLGVHAASLPEKYCGTDGELS